MSEAVCINDCNGHGSCISKNCSCDLGWFSVNNTSPCTINGSTEWGDAWSFYKIFFTILFLCLLLYSSFKLCSSLKQESTSDCGIKVVRTFKSPKNLSLLGITVIALIRVVWLSFDPLNFSGLSDRMADRLVFESVYPILFTVLSSVILVW